MDDYKKKVAPTGMWGRKERKMSKATARAQLKEETRVASLTWDELTAESQPLTEDLRDRIQELVKGVEVDLDAPIEDDDEAG